jgi:hypothetical protein
MKVSFIREMKDKTGKEQVEIDLHKAERATLMDSSEKSKLSFVQ